MPLSKPEAARVKRVLNQLRKVTAPLSQAHADLWPDRWEMDREQLTGALVGVNATIRNLEDQLEKGE